MSALPPSVEIVDLTPGEPALAPAWDVMAELRPHRDRAAMDATYAESHPLGYRITALLEHEECRAVAGWRIGRNMQLGRNLYVEDLVTTAHVRSAGHGALLLAHLREVARGAGCEVIHLDSGVQRHDAHRFYFREGMHIASYHFSQRL